MGPSCHSDRDRMSPRRCEPAKNIDYLRYRSGVCEVKWIGFVLSKGVGMNTLNLKSYEDEFALTETGSEMTGCGCADVAVGLL